MRREELVQLKIEQIDSARMLIHIRQGKGKKDRDVMLSPRLLQELRDYWRTAKRKPTTYLFPSQGSQPNEDVPMTSKSIWDAVHQAATRAGLDKRVHPHTQTFAEGAAASKEAGCPIGSHKEEEFSTTIRAAASSRGIFRFCQACCCLPEPRLGLRFQCLRSLSILSPTR
jgi:hypothetical protein